MSIELLRKLGVYIDPDFLPGDVCDRIVGDIDVGAKVETPLYHVREGENIHLPKLRQSRYSEVPAPTQRAVADRVKRLKPVLEAHFAEQFHDRTEAAKFVLYEQGHFFGSHSDNQLATPVTMGRRYANISRFLDHRAR